MMLEGRVRALDALLHISIHIDPGGKDHIDTLAYD
jgi:hypothetical protein